jgi:probable rRNA maturation factor
MIKVNVLSNERAWSSRLRKKELFFNNICRAFPKKYRFLNKKVSLTLLLSNNKNIKKLNKRFRDKNKPTDILSFPFHQKSKKSKEIYLGDIIISINYMNKYNNLSTYDFREKVAKIFIHGFLHLLDFDHIKEKDYIKMLNQEQKIFESVQKFIN